MAQLPDRLHRPTLEGLSRLAARRPLPTPDSGEAARVKPSLPRGARIHIVLKDADSWILVKFADRLAEELRAAAVEVSVGSDPDPSAAINHFVIYAAYENRGPTLETVMVTHVEDEDELSAVKRQVNHYGVEMAICMSFDTVHRLAHLGIPRERLCFVNPAHDQVISPRPLLVGLMNRLYDDGRKREGMLVDLCREISPRDFQFTIMGAGWELIVQQLRSAGFSVEYFQEFERETYRQLIPRLDYFLHLGRDEGAMGILDALAAGVATIVTPQGYHLDIPGAITHPFNDLSDLTRVFVEIATVRKKRVESVSALTWPEYARKHMLVWQYLLQLQGGQAVDHALVPELEALAVTVVEPPAPSAAAHATVRVSYEPPSPVEEQVSASNRQTAALRRLHRRFPDHRSGFNLIYLRSEDRGPDWQSLFWRARQSGAATVWNHGPSELVASVAGQPDGRHRHMAQALDLADYVFYRSGFAKSRADATLTSRSEQWEVLADPVDTDYFAPRPPRSNGDGGFSILLAGNSHPIDEIRTALRSLMAVRASLGDVRLLVSGSVLCSTSAPECRRLVASILAETGATNFVRWLEPYRRDNAPDMLAQADVLFHLALNDPCPTVVPEALASGVPVVYAASGAVGEFVGGAAGAGVSPDVAAENLPTCFADALTEVLTTRDSQREAARQRALGHFEIEHWLQRHEAVFESLTATAAQRSNSRTSVGPLKLLRLHPDHVAFGDRFNLQPDGQSALAVEAEAESAATCVVFNGRPLPTRYGGAGLLTALVPPSSIEPGSLEVHLVDGVTESNRLNFQVEISVEDQGHR